MTSDGLSISSRLRAASGESLFVGRESELSLLRALFLDEGVRCAAMIGARGVGKTSLAHVFAERFGGQLGRVYWQSAGDGRGLPELTVDADLRSTFVVVDDYETSADPTYLDSEIRKLMETGASVLIVGRFAPSQDLARAIVALEPLDLPSAEAFLRQAGVSDALVARTARSLGGLPLALRRFAELAQESGGAEAELLAAFEGISDEEAFASQVRSSSRTYGPTAPAALRARADLARVHAESTDFERAVIVLEALLDDQRAVLGLEHPDTTRTVANLGGVYQSLGRYDEAIELCQLAMEVQARTLGPLHSSTLTTLANIGAIHHVRGDVVAAANCYSDAIDGLKRSLGSRHPVTLQTLRNLADLYEWTDRPADAAHLREAIATDEDDVTEGAAVEFFEHYLAVSRYMPRLTNYAADASPDLVLPIYVVIDVSASVNEYVDELNWAVDKLFDDVARDPILDERVRLCLVSFSAQPHIELPLARASDVGRVPWLAAAGSTDYGSVFRLLRRTIGDDVEALRANHRRVARPIVFFLSDGSPVDDSWRAALAELLDPASPAWPRIVALGYGDADGDVIAAVGRDGALLASGWQAPVSQIRQALRSVSSTVVGSARADDVKVGAVRGWWRLE